MKTRTLRVKPDTIRIDGNAWGSEPLELVFEEYGNGKVLKRVRVRMRPIDVEDLANRLWEIQAKYKIQVDTITRALKGTE